jgi:biotin carboxyl carrier protein
MVTAGERVQAGQTLVVLEAMKMEHQIAAASDSVVEKVLVKVGDSVNAHQLLVVLKEDVE